MASTCTDAACRQPGLSWPARVIIGLAGTASSVMVAYYFIDEPVIAFVRPYGLDRYSLLKWPTRPPEAFVFLSPFALLALFLVRRFGPLTRIEKVAAAAAVSTMLAALATLLLKMTFGRSADGFRPFDFGAAYWAFPSGHTACTLSATVVAQAAFPRWRACWWSINGVVMGMLIALSHHCVGDILGGAYVGWAIGGTVARAFDVGPAPDAEPVARSTLLSAAG